MVKNSPATAGDTGDVGSIPGSGRDFPPGKEMATHSSILAWEVSWTEEPGGLVSPWCHKRVGCNTGTKQQQNQINSMVTGNQESWCQGKGARPNGLV